MEFKIIRQHLVSAICTLGADERPIDRRLYEVYQGDLSRISRQAALPARARRDYEQLMTELAVLFDRREGVDPEQASALAKRVVALYELVIEET